MNPKDFVLSLTPEHEFKACAGGEAISKIQSCALSEELVHEGLATLAQGHYYQSKCHDGGKKHP